MSRRALIFSLLCLVAATGAGCGQRGPLYLPDAPPPPAAPDAPAEAADDEDDERDGGRT